MLVWYRPHLENKIMRIGNLRCVHNVIFRRILHSERDVVEYGIVEQNTFLCNDAHHSPQVGQAIVFDVLSIEEDFTLLKVVKAR